MAIWNIYTPEMENFLRDNASKMTRGQLTQQFNLHFGMAKSVTAIKAYCNNRGWAAPDDGRFKDGNVSWQTGLTGDAYKSHFKDFNSAIAPMRSSIKRVEVGHETIKGGIPYVCVSDDLRVPKEQRRKPKARVVWEQHFGAIPSDHYIVFLDGNPMNCDIENLRSIPKKYKGIIGKNRWWGKSREMTLAAIKYCEHLYAIKNFGKGR